VKAITLAIFVLLLLSACAPADTLAQPIPSPTPVRTSSPLVGAGQSQVAAVMPTVEPTATPLCPLATLEQDAYISASGSYTETEDQAAGPMVCRIARGSCAYYKLVGSLDPQVIFARHKEPPYDEEDTLMHPAMLFPLARLRDMVAAEWHGEVQLLVTAAYDSSLLEHDLSQPDTSRRYSLHFEGRSIDLVVFPSDPALHPRLCALAHCAGFDWVHNEGTHCHASVRAESLCAMCDN
jgi:Hedgehog amino-terminal signalling domain